MKTEVKVANIHTNKRFPGVVYAELREVKDNSLVTSATFQYIINILTDPAEMERRQYLCVNAVPDRWGNLIVNPEESAFERQLRAQQEAQDEAEAGYWQGDQFIPW